MKKMHYLFALLMLVFSSFCFADEASPASNMVWLVTASALVFLMQAGFALLECGMSRSKNALNVVMKNYMDVCLGTLIFWAIGYGLMFGNNPSGFMGTDLFFMNDSDPASYGVLLFQTMFAATAVTIASGAMAERTRFDGYLVGALFITAVIYPIFGSWVWNADGWLAQMGFIDFAGSTVVHSVGAWTALAGIIILGPRLGRFDKHGKARELRGHNLSYVALGGFILWFGWFGFNGGSTLSATVDIGLINLNTQLAAAAGAAASMLLAVAMRRPILLTETVNGSIAGLVAITAGCATMLPAYAVLTGAIGGIVCVLGSQLLLRMQLDDVVGAVSAHGFAGAWGTLAAGMFYKGNLFDTHLITVQLIGIAACFIWTFCCALIMYFAIDLVMGLRAPSQHEQRGLDLSEHAEIGYPEFNSGNIAYTADRANNMGLRS
ncbi:ammonium transporter [gamma proteobacterium BDW918]|uniref:Ammonium transporter n=2 Tax=Zhongshania aliphaticivorans TaxID=1470434 RepID=A0A127M3P6_9GAMM|nr:ammonium transporter [Zhongshania aliphaticivorans]AMO67885.1 ammonium transporter [Zhongshania aliphaticivorans]EIF44703.1 ammonium transporter [gamma proteobacterium BDW918]|tara:strand:+ start:13860 stop:15164 length:1305 start_codon:yes stop_codon:yes gene_type:complete